MTDELDMETELEVEIVSGSKLHVHDEVVPLWIGLLDRDIACGRLWETVTDVTDPTVDDSYSIAATVNAKGHKARYGRLASRLFIRRTHAI